MLEERRKEKRERSPSRGLLYINNRSGSGSNRSCLFTTITSGTVLPEKELKSHLVLGLAGSFNDVDHLGG